MNLTDAKFKQHYKSYLIQSALAGIFIMFILVSAYFISNTIILSSLGATIFIAFTMPRAYGSRPRNIIGGYVEGTLVGILFYYFCHLAFFSQSPLVSEVALVVSSGLAVGVTCFLMVLTHTAHPPAVGMALGLLISQWDYRALAFTLAAVLILSFVKERLKPHLINIK